MFAMTTRLRDDLNKTFGKGFSVQKRGKFIVIKTPKDENGNRITLTGFHSSYRFKG